MAEVKKAAPDDFERVYPLFAGFNNPRLKKDDWQRIFHPPWAIEEDYCGYLLEENGTVLGYLGYIFSRLPGDSETKVCNLTTWIVNEEHRGQSLDLFYPAMKLDDYLVTDFSPTPSVVRMFEKRFKYKVLETSMWFVYPTIGFIGGGSCRMSFDDALKRDVLSEADRRTYEDHISLPCHHILIENDGGYAYLVARNRRHKKVRHLEVIYISDPGVLKSCAGPALRSICYRFGVFGLMIEERLLDGVTLPFSRRREPLITKLYKTTLPIEPQQVTHLYSEKVLL